MSRRLRPGSGGAPRAALALAAALLGAVSVPARPAAAQGTQALVVVGLGGTPEHREEFGAWAAELHGALTGRLGLPPAAVTVLAEGPDAVPGVRAGRSTREGVQAALADMARASGPGDRVMVVLIGHGTAQGDEGRLNLPGPDLSGAELALALSAFPTQTVAVVHTGSAGGGFVAPLAGPRRIVLSATRTARERNATEFPRYFVEALSGDGADLDKDGSVSLLEAFVYARSEVARHYAEEKEILTEHAVLDDDGDGRGSPDPGADAGDGPRADAFRLGVATAAPAPATSDPVLARLYEERRAIQQRIDALRGARGSMSEERYDAALEELLVELALKTREIRAREGGGA